MTDNHEEIRQAFDKMLSEVWFQPPRNAGEKPVIYHDGQWMTPSEFAAHWLREQHPPKDRHCPHCNAPLYLYYPEVIGEPETRQYECGTMIGADTQQSETCQKIESG